MQREEDALGRCQPGPEPGAWDDAKESPPGWARYLIFGVQSTRRGTAQQLERPAAVNRGRSSQQQPTQGTFLTAPFLPGAERHGQSNGSDPWISVLILMKLGFLSYVYVQHRQLIQIHGPNLPSCQDQGQIRNDNRSHR
ncbi:hypothetical protein CDV31_008598 [Fusarium ambrosium]|uniref:Uncharacterized protein n=1 Tax=Fusarium ambrosium TaxID=131363 RepID=A0A428TZN2_9HYPO|nr:hypothetical protein CDV31_008598 [Fusarium ambrosium]